MSRLRRQVEAAGYATWARTYPSRKMPVTELAGQIAAWVNEEIEGPVMAVTHSLGGILTRFVGDRVPWERIVMLAPPNRGSRVARALGENPVFKWYFGPAGRDVSNPEQWPLPTAPFGVIAGTKRVSVGNPPSWVTSSFRIIPKGIPSDGTVCVEETQLPSMAAYAEVAASHTWIMNHPRVVEHVLSFLEQGAFVPQDARLKG